MTTPGLEQGIVASAHRNRVLVLDRQRRPHVCSFGHDRQRAVAGDLAEWRRTGETGGVVLRILPRRTLIHRPVERGAGKPVAANVDLLLLVLAPRPACPPGLIDRCLVLAAFFGVRPCLVYNKIDLLDPAALDTERDALAVYAEIGTPCHWVSVRSGAGFDLLGVCLEGKTSILVGQSGVGKSSLTRRVTSDADITVRELSRRGGTGRHTTSATKLYPLPGDGWLMDSPGVRDFALWQIPAAEIANGFTEFRPFAGQCRFRDCRHDAEPGCALSAAAERGAISAERLASYREMINTAESARR